MSILDAIQKKWRETLELRQLIPEVRVFLGPPNPGTPLPTLGFVSVQIADKTRTSDGRYPHVTLRAVAESAQPDFLESLREAICAHLGEWTTERYGTMQLSRCELSMARSEDSPSTLWRGEFTLEYDLVAV